MPDFSGEVEAVHTLSLFDFATELNKLTKVQVADLEVLKTTPLALRGPDGLVPVVGVRLVKISNAPVMEISAESESTETT